MVNRIFDVKMVPWYGGNTAILPQGERNVGVGLLAPQAAGQTLWSLNSFPKLAYFFLTRRFRPSVIFPRPHKMSRIQSLTKLGQNWQKNVLWIMKKELLE